EQRLPRDIGDPVRSLVAQIHELGLLDHIIRAEPRSLQLLPVHRERLSALLGAVPKPPEDLVFPGRGRRDAPGAIGAPVVGEVAGEDRVALLEDTGTEGVGGIPAVPELAGTELRGFPAQVRLLRLADPEGAGPEELGVPLR